MAYTDWYSWLQEEWHQPFLLPKCTKLGCVAIQQHKSYNEIVGCGGICNEQVK